MRPQEPSVASRRLDQIVRSRTLGGFYPDLLEVESQEDLDELLSEKVGLDPGLLKLVLSKPEFDVYYRTPRYGLEIHCGEFACHLAAGKPYPTSDQIWYYGNYMQPNSFAKRAKDRGYSSYPDIPDFAILAFGEGSWKSRRAPGRIKHFAIALPQSTLEIKQPIIQKLAGGPLVVSSMECVPPRFTGNMWFAFGNPDQRQATAEHLATLMNDVAGINIKSGDQ